MDTIDIRFGIALVAAIVGFVIWLLQRWIQIRDGKKRLEQEQSNLIRALYAEIDFNTRDMEVFLAKSPDARVIRKALAENEKLVPHITDARHTEIYRNRIADIHTVADVLLHRTIEFYGLLEKIQVQVGAVNWTSFQTLSLDGKLNAVGVIRRTAIDAERHGQNLLADFATQYPELDLRRRSLQSLLQREEALARQLIALNLKIAVHRGSYPASRM